MPQESWRLQGALPQPPRRQTNETDVEQVTGYDKESTLTSKVHLNIKGSNVLKYCKLKSRAVLPLVPALLGHGWVWLPPDRLPHGQATG